MRRKGRNGEGRKRKGGWEKGKRKKGRGKGSFTIPILVCFRSGAAGYTY